MRESHFKFLQSRKADLLQLVKCPDTVISILFNCNIISQDISLNSFTFESVIDEIIQSCNSEILVQFCLILLLTGNFNAYSIFATTTIIDKSALKNITTFCDGIKLIFNPIQLSTIISTPSLPAKLCLRKFSNNNEKMNEKRKQFLMNLMELMELKLNLQPILCYLNFYEIFTDEHISSIKGSLPKDVIKSFVHYLIESHEIAFERFGHALVLSEQWILFGILHGSGLLDLNLMEELSKIHLEFLFDHENNNNKENSSSSSCFSPSSFIVDYENIPQPDGLLDIHVDETDSKTLTEIFNKDEVYHNFSKPKGLALIINNKNFPGQPERQGTDVDDRNIRDLLDKLGYVVEKTRHNIAAGRMLDIAKTFATSPDHKFYDSCVVVVLSHGKYDLLIGSDGEELDLHQFLKCFNSRNAPYLKGKPKLFLLQACRGDAHDYGTPQNRNIDCPDIFKLSELLSCVRTSPPRQRSYNNRNNNNNNGANFINEYLTTTFPSPPPPLPSSSEMQHHQTTKSTTTMFPTARSSRIQLPYAYGNARKNDIIKKVPTEADILIAFSTTPGYVAWRNQQTGSWFIQSVCEIFSKYASMEDICSLLTRVNKRVAEVYQSSSNGQKQIPEFTNRLQKRFYFFPGIHSPPQSSSPP